VVCDDITATATRKMFNDPRIGKRDDKDRYRGGQGKEYGNIGVTGECNKGLGRTIRGG